MSDHRKTEAFKEALRKGWQKRKSKRLGTAWNKGMKGTHFSPATEFKKGFRHTEETRAKFRLRRGPQTGNWKGGTTNKNTLIRTSLAYKEWRKKVFERDDYTCQMCGARGVQIHADHIKPFALFPELRLDLDNGRTLCVPCHKKTPTYLKGRFKPSNQHENGDEH